MRTTIHTSRLSIRLPEDILIRLDAVAGPYGRTDFIRHLLLEAIERLEADKPKTAAAKSPSKPEKPATVDPMDCFSEAEFWRIALIIDSDEQYWTTAILPYDTKLEGMQHYWTQPAFQAAITANKQSPAG